MKTIHYLCGPMTGLPELNHPAFHRAAASLRAQGLTVFNPAEKDLPIGAPWSQHMRADIRALMGADVVVTLPGWPGSKGAALEVHIARQLGMPIVSLASMLGDYAGVQAAEDAAPAWSGTAAPGVDMDAIYTSARAASLLGATA